METQNTEKSLFEFSFDENVKQSLRGAAVWGGMAALVSIIGSALSLVNFFMERSRPSRTYSFDGYGEMRTSSTESAGQLVVVIISLIIGILLFYFLNNFSKKTKTGIDTNDQQHLSEGLGSLSTYFKFVGALLIICLVFFFLALAGGLGSRM